VFKRAAGYVVRILKAKKADLRVDQPMAFGSCGNGACSRSTDAPLLRRMSPEVAHLGPQLTKSKRPP
jgi:hypothetical protein